MCARRYLKLDPEDEAASFINSFNYDPDYSVRLNEPDSFCYWWFDLVAPWGFSDFPEDIVTDCLNAFTARFIEGRRDRIVCR